MMDIEKLKRQIRPDTPSKDYKYDLGYNAAIDYLAERGMLGGVAEWQPIESAPDNDFILVCCKYEPEDESDYKSGVSVVWKEQEGWAVGTNDADDCYGITYISGKATHWMPLPQPPKKDEV